MNNRMFTCGPFMSASLGLDSVALGLYNALLISESVHSQQEYKTKIHTAIQGDATEEEIANLKREAEYYGGLLDITMAALASTDGIDE